jgi:glutamate-1-semialdehyde 2,1-aminomutase
MADLAPTGPVYQAGTLAGNPLATAAGHAVLSAVSATDYEELARRAARLAAGLQSSVTAAGLAAVTSTCGPLVGMFVGPPGTALALPSDYAAVREINASGVYAELFHAMLDRGVALAPGAYEVMFPGLAHGDREIDLVIDVAGDAATDVSGRF